MLVGGFRLCIIFRECVLVETTIRIKADLWVQQVERDWTKAENMIDSARARCRRGNEGWMGAAHGLSVHSGDRWAPVYTFIWKWGAKPTQRGRERGRRSARRRALQQGNRKGEEAAEWEIAWDVWKSQTPEVKFVCRTVGTPKYNILMCWRWWPSVKSHLRFTANEWSLLTTFRALKVPL